MANNSASGKFAYCEFLHSKAGEDRISRYLMGMKKPPEGGCCFSIACYQRYALFSVPGELADHLVASFLLAKPDHRVVKCHLSNFPAVCHIRVSGPELTGHGNVAVCICSHISSCAVSACISCTLPGSDFGGSCHACAALHFILWGRDLASGE